MDRAFGYMESNWRAQGDIVGYRSTKETEAADRRSVVFDEGNADEDEAVCRVRICPGHTTWLAEVEYHCVGSEVGGVER